MSEASPTPAAFPSYLERAAPPVAWSLTARHESWRKERHRPATYVHKWWARRLGSVTRNLLIAAVSPEDKLLVARPDLLKGLTAYDPFAGSGTALVEAAKLGAAVIGRDINPVATLTQRQAFHPWIFKKVEELFGRVAEQCQQRIEEFHQTADGEPVQQYFWVAVVCCPECQEEVELFSTHVFAKHAYPNRFPSAHIVCPACHGISPVDLSKDTVGRCLSCEQAVDFAGASQGRFMRCRNGHRSSVLEAVRRGPLRRVMYAKRVLGYDGMRAYRSIDAFDNELFGRACATLAGPEGARLVQPMGSLEHGQSTAQALRWGFHDWAEFFNERQLYSLGLIATALRDLPDAGSEREALIAAFGRTVEHHNLFCTYKGEGTGPVRSIFHNHVLRPERSMVEGDPWGRHGGSAGYAQVLERLEQAHRYKRAPQDFVYAAGGGLISRTGYSAQIERSVASTWESFSDSAGGTLISTGDAADTDLPDRSVDLIVTDPPYVDNVHYSELADFFHAWLRGMRPYPSYPVTPSTRTERELQNADPEDFQRTASRAWKECARVLRPGGMLIFSFHQSRSSGWSALMRSLRCGGFAVTATRAIVAEVATSLSKLASREPNTIDIIVICRPAEEMAAYRVPDPASASASAREEIALLRDAGLALGPADVRTAVRAAVLACGTWGDEPCWSSLQDSADQYARAAVADFADNA